MKALFDDATFKYTIDQKEVDALTAKGASAAIARSSKAKLQVALQRLQNQQATLQETYELFKRETKILQMAEFALANGGIDQVKDWSRAEQIIETQWSGDGDSIKGINAFFKDIEAGRYGTTSLGKGFLARGLMSADAGRATYENERLAAQMMRWQMEAKRVMGGVEHCTDCPAWAALGWIEAAVMYAKYAIGMAQCKINDYCVIVTRRKAEDAKQAVGWNALLPSLQSATRVTGSAATLAAAVTLLKYAARNPSIVQVAIGLLLKVLGGTKV